MRHGTRSRRIQSVLLVCGALMLFLFGLLLLFAPAPARGELSKVKQDHFPSREGRWIMGSQSRKPIFLAGG